MEPDPTKPGITLSCGNPPTAGDAALSLRRFPARQDLAGLGTPFSAVAGIRARVPTAALPAAWPTIRRARSGFRHSAG